MVMTDPIADMLTRIRNANKMRHTTVDIPASKAKKDVLTVLANEGFIVGYDEVKLENNQSVLKVTLKYTASKERVIKGLKESGSTMIVVTHEMEFAQNVSDKIIFMADGVIEEMGTPEEIFENPRSEKTRHFLQNSLSAASVR